MTQYELFYFLFRNKWIILAGVLCGLIAAGAVLLLKPREYRSEAMLLVRYVSDTVPVDPKLSGEQVLTPGRPGDMVIGTEVDILNSAELIATAARAMADAASNTNHTFQPMTAGEIASNFEVTVGKNSSTIRLNVDGPSPDSAKQALEAIIKAYLNKHQEVHKDSGAFDFISRQADEMRTKVNDTEDELRRLKNQAGIISLAESRSMFMARIQDLDKNIRDKEGVLAANQARIQVLTQQIAQLSIPLRTNVEATVQADAPRSPQKEEAVRQLNELGRRELDLLRVYTSNSTPVQVVRQQIAELARAIGEPVDLERPASSSLSDTRTPVRPVDVMISSLSSCQTEIAAVQAQLELLKKQMETVQAEAKRTESVEAQIVRLERMREIYESNLRYFSQRLETARIDNAMDASKISNLPLLQPPTLPSKPLWKELYKLLAMILAACTGCGILLAFLREFVVDQTIRHPFEVSRLLHIPLLATLHQVRRGMRMQPAGSAKPVTSSAPTLALNSACEMITQIVREHVESKSQTLLVGFTAPHSGAGVTAVSEQVANAMKFYGFNKVLLAKVAPDGQFTGKLLGETTTSAEARELPPLNTGDTGIQNAVEIRHPWTLTYSSSMTITPSVLDQFHGHEYDCVLFDLPPVTESEVTVRLLSRMDGIVLILETLKTQRTQAMSSVHQLEQLHCCIYGAVLNKFRTPVPAGLSSPPETHGEMIATSGTANGEQ